MTGDMISNEDPTSGVTILPEQAPRRRGTKATALTAAALLVGTAGVATALFRGSSSDRDPATVIPANAFGVATIHLDLPGGQDSSISQILGLFPGVKLPDGGSLTDRVFRAMTKDSTPPVDYDKDIKPWLGDSATVAGWLDNGKPTLEIVLASTDDNAARAHLPAMMSGSDHFEVHDGWVVLGNSQADIDDALKAAATSALAGTGSYATDLNTLPSNELVTGWLDGAGAVKALQGALGSAGGGLSMFGALGAGNLAGALKDRLALGLHVADDVVQLDFRDVGSTTKTPVAMSPSSLLTQLPAGTIGAFELGDPAGVLKAVTPVIKIFGSFVGASQVCSSSGFAVAPAIPKQLLLRQLRRAIPPGTPHRQAQIRKLLGQVRQARANSSLPSGGTCKSTSSAASDPLAEIQKALGISFPDDLETILGDKAVVAFGGLELGGLPDVAIRSHPTNLSSAQSLAQQMTTHLGSTTPLHLSTTTAGDDLILATSPSYGAEIGKTGTFGDAPQVQKALDGLPADVAGALYLDLSRIWPFAGASVPDSVKHLKAIGLWSGKSGDVTTLQLRVVFG